MVSFWSTSAHGAPVPSGSNRQLFTYSHPPPGGGCPPAQFPPLPSKFSATTSSTNRHLHYPLSLVLSQPLPFNYEAHSDVNFWKFRTEMLNYACLCHVNQSRNFNPLPTDPRPDSRPLEFPSLLVLSNARQPPNWNYFPTLNYINFTGPFQF